MEALTKVLHQAVSRSGGPRRARGPLAGMVHNATSWDYPMSVHESLCCELRVNPAVYIVPGWTKELFTEHFSLHDYMDTEAFSDEVGNVVYFFEDYWTPKYRLWLMHHEMFHQTQYFDKGNYRGRRWDDMSVRKRTQVWEKEADAFANERVGVLEADVPRYCREPGDTSEPFVKRFLGDLMQKQQPGRVRMLVRSRR